MDCSSFYDDVIDFIQEHSEGYVAFKENHSFKFTPDEIRTFLAILLVSGYSTDPRGRIYWSNDTEARNAAIASSMARARFDEIMRYCHVSGNNDLNAEDKMSKIRPLITVIHDRCLQFFLKQ